MAHLPPPWVSVHPAGPCPVNLVQAKKKKKKERKKVDPRLSRAKWESRVIVEEFIRVAIERNALVWWQWMGGRYSAGLCCGLGKLAWMGRPGLWREKKLWQRVIHEWKELDPCLGNVRTGARCCWSCGSHVRTSQSLLSASAAFALWRIASTLPAPSAAHSATGIRGVRLTDITEINVRLRCTQLGRRYIKTARRLRGRDPLLVKMASTDPRDCRPADSAADHPDRSEWFLAEANSVYMSGTANGRCRECLYTIPKLYDTP